MKRVEDNYSHYLHQNGLVQLNIQTSGSYSAVLVINTPALDDSGVSHAVEHFIFRRSQHFPQAITLFQLTALTDLTINASTLSDKTYYHCQSRYLDSFLLGLKYLLSGMLTPCFIETDLQEELTDHQGNGVIYRELTALSNDEDSAKLIQANLSDLSDERCYQYAGNCQTISSLNLEDLKRYHQTFYQSKMITLVTENVAPELIADCFDELLINKEQYEHNNHYTAKPLAIVTEYCQRQSLLRYWLNDAFFSFIASVFDDLASMLNSYELELLPLQRNLNKDGNFPLDIIFTTSEQRNQKIINGLLQQYLTNQYPHFIKQKNEKQGNKMLSHQQKFTDEINQLLNVYHIYAHRKLNDNNEEKKEEKSLEFNLGKARVHKLAKLNTLNNINYLQKDSTDANVSKQVGTKPQWQEQKPTSDKTSLIKPLQSLHQKLAKQDLVKHVDTQPKTVTVPRVINGAFQKSLDYFTTSTTLTATLKVSTVYDADHCVISLKVKPEDEALAMILTYIINAYPQFLSSRIQGHCYLISSLFVKEHNCLVLFSAYDIAPEKRVADIAHVLLALSQDKTFIKESMPLAKKKYQSIYNHNFASLAKIDVLTISNFLASLSNCTHER